MVHDDRFRGAVLTTVGVALHKQAARTGSLSAIDELIAVSGEALHSEHSEQPGRGHRGSSV
jgi:hypothetical protein